MYVIIGCGSVGLSVARLIADKGKTVILDNDPKRVKISENRDLMLLLGMQMELMS